MIKKELYEHELTQIPKNIRYFRERAAISRVDLCKQTGIDYSWLSKAERGDSLDLKLSSILVLCEAFGISVNDFVYGPSEDF